MVLAAADLSHALGDDSTAKLVRDRRVDLGVVVVMMEKPAT